MNEPGNRLSGSFPTGKPLSGSSFDSFPSSAGSGARNKPGSSQPGSTTLPSQSGPGPLPSRTSYNAGRDGNTPAFNNSPENSGIFPTQDGSDTSSSRFNAIPSTGSDANTDSGTAGRPGSFPSQSGSDTPSSRFNTGPNTVTNAATDANTPAYNSIPGAGSSSLPGFRRIPDSRAGASDTSSPQQGKTSPSGGSQLPSLAQTQPGQGPRPYDQLQSGSTGLTPNGNQPGSDSQSQSPITSDIMARLRDAFKLPPGFCLVRCDTLKTGQVSLTPEQVKDAFTSAGLFGNIK